MLRDLRRKLANARAWARFYLAPLVVRWRDRRAARARLARLVEQQRRDTAGEAF